MKNQLIIDMSRALIDLLDENKELKKEVSSLKRKLRSSKTRRLGMYNIDIEVAPLKIDKIENSIKELRKKLSKM